MSIVNLSNSSCSLDLLDMMLCEFMMKLFNWKSADVAMDIVLCRLYLGMCFYWNRFKQSYYRLLHNEWTQLFTEKCFYLKIRFFSFGLLVIVSLRNIVKYFELLGPTVGTGTPTQIVFKFLVVFRRKDRQASNGHICIYL